MLASLWVNRIINWFSFNLICSISIEKWYSFIMLVIFSGLMFTRCPYIYGYIGFILILFVLVIPLYLCLVFTRFYTSVSSFFADMIPQGSPLWILPFIPHVELISFIIRPVVLLIRPFINVSVGVYSGLMIGDLCMISLNNNVFIITFLFILFVYEVFVILVHWFIIKEILKFTISH
uniref:ATP synthase F0 subunit 6 n=1 Tax=Schmidtea mediterranea TaxID=79327 RepID=A0A2Z5QKG9_SCHMD|nr:ATP synthase F0 subunit 6 [Schistosoma mattheei]